MAISGKKIEGILMQQHEGKNLQVQSGWTQLK